MKQLRPYQELAVEFLQQRKRAALFLDMGLGKTIVCLTALRPEHLPALVIAPKRVVTNVWPVEARDWRPDLDVRCAVGEPSERRAVLTSDADVVVLGQDNLKDLLSGPRAPFRTVVIDELSGYKSWQSVRFKTSKKVFKDFPHVWGLTGTPTPNGYLNLWSQVYLLDRGQRLGPNITTYRSRYFRPGRQIANGTIVEWDLREEAEPHIKALIEDICLSMESEGRVELPPVTVNEVKVDLPPPVRKIYAELERELIVNLEMLGGKVHTAANAAILTTKLSQVAAGFVYENAEFDPVTEKQTNVGEFTPVHTEKIKALQDIVAEAQGSPVLVFYRFRPERDMILSAISGARDIDDGNAIEEWNKGRVPVMVAHPASAGHGLNLQFGGHTIVWTSLDWDLELWEQANKRLARPGQEHPVVIHWLSSAKVDRLIHDRLDGKADVQNDLLAYLESPV